MKVILVSLLLFGLARAKLSCDCGKRNTGRIVGGKHGRRNEYPWMVGFQKTDDIGFTFCGGAIITPRHVISAAHCFENNAFNNIIVIVGAHDINNVSESSSQRHSVSEIFIHPNYNNAKYKLNDLSIVVTTKEMEFNEFVGPICMPTVELGREMIGQLVRVLGWGRYESDFQNYDKINKLRQADLKLVSHRLCNNPDAPLFCAQYPERGSCMGDSGGPLAWLDRGEGRFMLVGVISYGFAPCGNSTSPTVNTNVSGHLKWINEKIKRVKSEVKTCNIILE